MAVNEVHTHKTHRPRKRFGQNFLSDPMVIEDIITSINIRPDDHLVEIGPGLGALTELLITRAHKLSAIEIDRDLAAILKQSYAEHSNFELYTSDALSFDYRALKAPALIRVIGNLPYNISTPLLFHLLTYRELIKDMHFMLQQEVVDRLAAEPGSKSYGRLTVMMQYHCAVEALFSVPPTAFTPSPKVTSAVVRLIPHTTLPCRANDPAMFTQLVKLCFQQRRKTLRNSLKNLTTDPEKLTGLDIDLRARPETLSVADFVAISNSLSLVQ